MTRYIGEPSPEKKIAEGRALTESLARRPAPEIVASGGGATESVALYAWSYTTNNLVADKTWTAVARQSGGLQYGYFGTAWLSNSAANPNFTYNFDNGQLSHSTDAHYIVHGWVQFWDDAVVGESRAIAINRGSSYRYVNEITCRTITGVGDQHLTVTAHILSDALPTCWLECWHDHGSNISIRDAAIFATKLEPFSAADTYPRP